MRGVGGGGTGQVEAVSRDDFRGERRVDWVEVRGEVGGEGLREGVGARGETRRVRVALWRPRGLAIGWE